MQGDKCKFSHDPNVERKSEKRDIYSDSRDTGGDKQAGELDVLSFGKG